MAFPTLSPKLQTVLEQIASDVVDHMGCVGAMVMTVEQGPALVARAFALQTDMVGLETISQQNLKSIFADMAIPLQDDKYANHLAVRAVQEDNGRSAPFLFTSNLAELLIPPLDEQAVAQLQAQATISQAVVLPLMLHKEIVGALFAAVSHPLTDRQTNILSAYGRQATIAIQNQRRLEAMQALERIVLRLQAHIAAENDVLQTIATGVVDDLGYAGAMVAPLEKGHSLPIRAFATDLDAATLQEVVQQVGIHPLSAQATVHLDDAFYRENLGVRAVGGSHGRPEKYLLSDTIYDLLRPLVSQAAAATIQQRLHIKQVIAVPFLQADEVVGNLFVISRNAIFSEWEISLLTALGQQAAASLRNARLYHAMSEQRQIAQTFSRMAFSTVASAHALRNHVGNVNGYIQLLQMIPSLTTERQQTVINELPAINEEIDKIINILDNLNEPWRQIVNESVAVNDSLKRALHEIFPKAQFITTNRPIHTAVNITLILSLAENLPPVQTARDMLAEAFRIILKNAVEALTAVSPPPNKTIWITSQITANNHVAVIIKDNGPGIPTEDIPRAFEMGWSTKNGSGMGFGLFWTKDYIDGLGGKITVQSAVGAGAEFTITLPVTVPTATAVGPPTPATT